MRAVERLVGDFILKIIWEGDGKRVAGVVSKWGRVKG
jgi:hypothetical protein